MHQTHSFCTNRSRCLDGYTPMVACSFTARPLVRWEGASSTRLGGPREARFPCGASRIPELGYYRTLSIGKPINMQSRRLSVGKLVRGSSPSNGGVWEQQERADLEDTQNCWDFKQCLVGPFQIADRWHPNSTSVTVNVRNNLRAPACESIAFTR